MRQDDRQKRASHVLIRLAVHARNRRDVMYASRTSRSASVPTLETGLTPDRDACRAKDVDAAAAATARGVAGDR